MWNIINHWIYACLITTTIVTWKLVHYRLHWPCYVVAIATSFSKHYVEFKVPTISHKQIAFLEFPFLSASFYILLTIIRHCRVTNKRIKECLSVAMKIGQGEASDVRVIHTSRGGFPKIQAVMIAMGPHKLWWLTFCVLMEFL
jgi:hypothetical protein